MTHREFLTWEVWLDAEWSHPSRSDHYMMQVATEVRRVLSKNPNGIKIKDFRLTFGESGERERKKISEKELAEQTKQSWAAYLGAKLGKVIDVLTGKPKEDSE